MIQLQTLGRVRLQGDRSGGDAGPAAAQPKRLALLAYLALMSGRGPVRRDVLLALFWPELGDEEARRALRQALHYLRRVLGGGVPGRGRRAPAAAPPAAHRRAATGRIAAAQPEVDPCCGGGCGAPPRRR